jgi:hypothetical protein
MDESAAVGGGSGVGGSMLNAPAIKVKPSEAIDLYRAVLEQEALKQFLPKKDRRSITERVELRVNELQKQLASVTDELRQYEEVQRLLRGNPEFDRLLTALNRLEL